MTPKQKFEDLCSKEDVQYSYYKIGSSLSWIDLKAPHGYTFRNGKSEAKISDGYKAIHKYKDAIKLIEDGFKNHMHEVLELAREEERNKEEQRERQKLSDELDQLAELLDVTVDREFKGNKLKITLTAQERYAFYTSPNHTLVIEQTEERGRSSTIATALSKLQHAKHSIVWCGCDECIDADNKKYASYFETLVITDQMSVEQGQEVVADLKLKDETTHEQAKKLANGILQTAKYGESRESKWDAMVHMHYFKDSGDFLVLELDPVSNSALVYGSTNWSEVQPDFHEHMSLDALVNEGYRLNLNWKSGTLGETKSRLFA